MALPGRKVPRRELEELLPMRSFWWLLESAPDGILIVDSQGRVMLASAQAEELFGYLEDELIGRPVERLMPRRFQERHVEDRAEYLANPRTRPMGAGMELYGIRRDGSEFPVEISLSPVQTKIGLVTMAIVRDVTLHKREHFISQTLQKAMLSSPLTVFDGLTIASAYRSAYTGALVGGDLFDVFTITSDQVGIAIGDVSGKGVEAAVYTALTKYSLRAYAYEDSAPAGVLRRLNSAVYRQSDPDIFTTMLYGVLDISTRSFRFSNAGHPLPLHISGPEGGVTEPQLYGLPLGVLPNADYGQHALDLEHGDRVFLYSDGVTDARDGDRGFYGIENLIEFLRTKGSEPPEALIGDLLETVEEWSGDRLRDDIAMLLLCVD